MTTVKAPKSTSDIELLMAQLRERKASLEAQLPVEEQLKVALEKEWGPYVIEAKESFGRKLSMMQKVVRLELAILASVKEFLDPEIISNLKDCLARARGDDNLQHMTSVYIKNKDDVKVRQVLKLVSAVYRVNRDIFSGVKSSNQSTHKSTIRYATLCPHCGETSEKILKNLENSRSVFLP